MLLMSIFNKHLNSTHLFSLFFLSTITLKSFLSNHVLWEGKKKKKKLVKKKEKKKKVI